MAALLLWVTLAIGSQSFAVQDRFDIIELNHTHDQMGRPKFVQLIFWDWSPKKKSFVCQGYYMLDGSIVKTEEGKKRDRIIEAKDLLHLQKGVIQWAVYSLSSTEAKGVCSTKKKSGPFVTN